MLILDSKSLSARLKEQSAKFSTSAWYWLRRPTITWILLAIVGLVLGLGLIIPQLSSPTTTEAGREAWLASLPPLVQPVGELLFSLGFTRLFYSPWYWLPLGLLLLNSLITLADYGPGAWQRLKPSPPSLDWQHPLAHRAEQSTRLPESPDTFLDELKAALTTQGFYLYPTSEGEGRLISAAQRRWAWLGPAIFYTGLLVGISALVVSHYFLQIDTLTLLPLDPKTSPLFAGKFELTEVDPNQQESHVTYLAEEDEPINLTWRLYVPTFFRGALIWPRAMEPILTIEARDQTGKLLRLIPTQENLFPAERLHLPLPATDTPVYFLIPSTSLAFQIVPDGSNPGTFQVKVRRGAESTPVAETKAQPGEAFTLDGVMVTMVLNSNITVMVHRDPALPLYLIGLGLIVVAGIFIFWKPPRQFWFIPEVKGRGGQLYGVVEEFGKMAKMPQFLAALLSKGDN